MNDEVEKITKESRILTYLKKSYSSVRSRRWGVSGMAPMALTSKSNLEVYHLAWLGVRWNRMNTRPRKKVEPSRIHQTWFIIYLCCAKNKRKLNKKGKVCFHQTSTKKSIGIREPLSKCEQSVLPSCLPFAWSFPLLSQLPRIYQVNSVVIFFWFQYNLNDLLPKNVY